MRPKNVDAAAVESMILAVFSILKETTTRPCRGSSAHDWVWRFDLGLWKNRRPECVNVAVGSGRSVLFEGAGTYGWCIIFEAFICYMPLLFADVLIRATFGVEGRKNKLEFAIILSQRADASNLSSNPNVAYVVMTQFARINSLY